MLSFQNSLLANCIHKHVNENIIKYSKKYCATVLPIYSMDKKFHILPYKAIVSEHKRLSEGQKTKLHCATPTMMYLKLIWNPICGACNESTEYFKAF